MSDRQALLAAIIAEPEDDAPRLIYADWLDEHGEPDRAEFIRIQCELATYPRTGLDRDAPVDLFGRRERRFLKWGNNRKALRRREHLLLTKENRLLWSTFGDSLNLSICAKEWNFSRGFVHYFQCEAADCLRYLDAILAEHPVTSVTVTDMPRWRFTNEYTPVYTLIGDPEEKTFTTEELDDVYEESDPTSMNLLRCRWPRVKFHLPLSLRFALSRNVGTFAHPVWEGIEGFRDLVVTQSANSPR